MNKLLTLFLVLITTFSFAQKGKVFSASTSLSEGNILEAKKFIDEAMSDAEVQIMAKAWVTKGEIYAQIYATGLEKELKVGNSLEIAEEAFKKGYELDVSAEKKTGKYTSTIGDGLLNAAIGHFEKGAENFKVASYDVSLKNFMSSAGLIDFIQQKDLVKAESKADAAQVKLDAYQNSALCALNLKDYSKAIEIYNILIKLGDATDNVYANLATLYISKEQYEEAKGIIDAGRAKFPTNESLAESELNYYIGTDQSDKAVGKLETAIKANPTNPDLYFNLALAYDKLNQDDAMVQAYEKIIQLDPKYYGAYLNLGAFYNDKANEVIKTMNDMTDWKEALKLEPKRDEWYHSALPFLEIAYKLDPTDPKVIRALERIYANMNMLDKIKELKGN